MTTYCLWASSFSLSLCCLPRPSYVSHCPSFSSTLFCSFLFLTFATRVSIGLSILFTLVPISNYKLIFWLPDFGLSTSHQHQKGKIGCLQYCWPEENVGEKHRALALQARFALFSFFFPFSFHISFHVLPTIIHLHFMTIL